MTGSILRKLGLFLLLAFLQVLIFNHIILFGVAIPFVYIYFIVRQPIGMGEKSLMTWAFFLGLTVDICCDTLGMNALACVIMAMLRRKIFFTFMLRDDNIGSLIPSIHSMGFGNYLKYLLSFVTLFCILIFSIEYFSIDYVKEIAIMAAGSTVLTTVILMCLDSFTTPKRDKRL